MRGKGVKAGRHATCREAFAKVSWSNWCCVRPRCHPGSDAKRDPCGRLHRGPSRGLRRCRLGRLHGQHGGRRGKRRRGRPDRRRHGRCRRRRQPRRRRRQRRRRHAPARCSAPALRRPARERLAAHHARRAIWATRRRSPSIPSRSALCTCRCTRAGTAITPRPTGSTSRPIAGRLGRSCRRAATRPSPGDAGHVINIHSGSLVSLIVDPVERGVMYTASNYGPAGIYKSTNGGVDWDQLVPARPTTVPALRRMVQRAVRRSDRPHAPGRRDPHRLHGHVRAQLPGRDARRRRDVAPRCRRRPRVTNSAAPISTTRPR